MDSFEMETKRVMMLYPAGRDAGTGIVVVVGVESLVSIERIVMEYVDDGDGDGEGIGMSHDKLGNDILALNLTGMGQYVR